MTLARVKLILLLTLLVSFLSQGETCTPGRCTEHLTACNKYYICVKVGLVYTNILQTCPPGLNFDPSKEICTMNYYCLVCD